MRFCLTGRAVAVVIALGPLLPGCTEPYVLELSRVDPQEAAERSLQGAVLGAALGASLGAIVAINPGAGALIGTEIGAPVGAAIGYATTPPLPDYKPIAVPASAVIPGFYDRWPPGNHPPPLGSGVPPPPPS